MPVRTDPPATAARVFPLDRWEVLYQLWRDYVQGIDPEPPSLGLPGNATFYVTDPESLFGCRDAADFGERLALSIPSDEGCGVVFFPTQGLTIIVPEPGEGATEKGLTAGGAREWTVEGNIQFDLNPGGMEAFVVSADGQRIGPVS